MARRKLSKVGADVWHLHMVMPPELRDAIDQWLEELRIERPSMSRADLIREVLVEAMRKRRR